jgi:D-alanyl-lipoteichoic acid acyltransferase DltB (MBOAT superfamily)
MQFNSIEFLFIFLPATLLGFYLLNNRAGSRAGVAWLAMASLAFFAWWDARYLALIGASMAWNWWMGTRIAATKSKTLLVAAVAVDLAVLGYYKYANFFVDIVGQATGETLVWSKVVLPLGISFFTFTQIAFVVDAFRGKVIERSPLNYLLFVTYFPHLVAGPILHHSEMMPQFETLQGKRPDARVIASGLFLLLVGLFKKVVIADSIAKYVDPAFANVGVLQIMDAWTAALGYTLQLYFDFSAYSEMAMGMSLLFGVSLPLNFNSPYKATDISDFWKRWHMTLSRFLRDYVYIPLGGNRHGFGRTIAALVATMLLGGLWHGAGWTFIAWGAMHGAMLVSHRLWKKAGGNIGEWPGRVLTMTGVLAAWVVFRADSLKDALTIWRKMLGMDGIVLPSAFRGLRYEAVKISLSPLINGTEIIVLLVLLVFCMTQKNVHEMWASMQAPRWRQVGVLWAMATCVMFMINSNAHFIYWNF